MVDRCVPASHVDRWSGVWSGVWSDVWSGVWSGVWRSVGHVLLIQSLLQCGMFLYSWGCGFEELLFLVVFVHHTLQRCPRLLSIFDC